MSHLHLQVQVLRALRAERSEPLGERNRSSRLDIGRLLTALAHGASVVGALRAPSSQ